MAKNQVMEMEDMDDEFDFDADAFCDHDHAMEDGVVSSMMNAMMETNREHMKIAMELTKLISEKTAECKSKDAILETFNQTMQAIEKNSPLKPFIEKMMAMDEEMA